MPARGDLAGRLLDCPGDVAVEDAELGVGGGRSGMISPSACRCAASSPVPEMGKFSTARCVCARHSAAAGTCTAPMVSCSVRQADGSAG